MTITERGAMAPGGELVAADSNIAMVMTPEQRAIWERGRARRATRNAILQIPHIAAALEREANRDAALLAEIRGLRRDLKRLATHPSPPADPPPPAETERRRPWLLRVLGVR